MSLTPAEMVVMLIHNFQLVVNSSQLFVTKLRIANRELPIVNDRLAYFKPIRFYLVLCKLRKIGGYYNGKI